MHVGSPPILISFFHFKNSFPLPPPAKRPGIPPWWIWGSLVSQPWQTQPPSTVKSGLAHFYLSGQVQGRAPGLVGSLGNWELIYINTLAQKISQINSQTSKQKQWICAGSLFWVQKGAVSQGCPRRGGTGSDGPLGRIPDPGSGQGQQLPQDVRWMSALDWGLGLPCQKPT